MEGFNQRIDFTAVRKNASLLLSQKGNRLLLVEALLICMLLVPMYGILDVILFYLHIPLISARMLLLMVLTFFFAVPLLLGMFFLAEQLRIGEQPVLVDLFHYFSSHTLYRRSVWYGATTFFPWVLLTLLCGLTYTVLFAAFMTLEGGSVLVAILCGCVVALEVIFGTLLCLRRFPVIFALLRYENLSYKSAVKQIKPCTPFATVFGLRFFFCFLPQILLGICTVGVFLLADTIPRMLFTYVCSCADRENHF